MKDKKDPGLLSIVGGLIVLFAFVNIALAVIVSILYALGGGGEFDAGQVATVIFILSLILTPLLLLLVGISGVEMNKRDEQEARKRRLRQLQQKTAAAQLRFPPVISLPQHVLLRRGERCHYQGKATLLVIKHEVVGHRTSYSGSSVEILDGFSLDSGSGYSQAVRGLVPYTYPGLLTITSQRVIMTGESSFEHSVSSLTSMQFLENYDGLELQFGGTTCKLLLDDPFIVDRILNLVR